MTAYTVDELIQEALIEGAYGILYKPLDMNNVLSLIEKARESKEGGFILVVDDDPGTTITLRNILSKRGNIVGIAHTGEEAISLAHEKEYDVIIIDMKLPTINGLETYLAIKKIDSKIVAIMMTGFRQEMGDLVEAALTNNAYTCLYKPLDIDLLLKLIDNVLKLRKE